MNCFDPRSGVAVAAILATVIAYPASAQDVDPALAESWAFMQETMPGVSYDLLEAACEEGEVVIYHGTWEEAQRAQLDGFRERFPCLEVQGFGSATGERRERFLAEARAGRLGADIYQDTDVGTLNEFIEEGLVAEYNISNEDSFRPGNMAAGRWYPLRVALVGIAWNTDLVSEEEAEILSDWQGLTDPRWQDRGIVVDPRAGGVAYLPWYAWNELYGEEFIEALGGLNPRVISGINNAASALASGDVAIIFNASETGLLPLLERGAPVQWSLPDPGVGPLTGQIVPTEAPHPNAARLYQEYSFTEEGYGLWHELGGAAARIGFEDRRPVADNDWYVLPENMFEYDPAEATDATPAIVEMFNKYVGDSQ